MGGRVFGHTFLGLFRVLIMVTAASASGAAAQGVAGVPANNGAVAAKKEIKFEVISMRPARPGFSPYDGGATHMSDTNPTPDGFITTMTVWQMLMLAYAPDDGSMQNVPLVNPPKWLSDHDPTWYVINARVSDADRNAWRAQDRRHVLLHAAMRDLLKERCKLVAHEQPTPFPDYELVIRKHGLKMKVAAPGAVPPKEASPLPTGGARFATGARDRPTWHYYGAAVGELIDFLRPPGTSSPAPPIHDKTGLTGRYNFSLSMIEEPSHDPDAQTFNFPVEPLGLELKRGTYPGYKLVIEHMEKPAAN